MKDLIEKHYMNKSIKKKSTIKGIYYTVINTGTYRFVKVMHEKSNTAIINYVSAPVSKVTDVIKAVDKTLKEVDWDIPENKFTKKHGEVVKKLWDIIVLQNGKYVVIK